MEQVLPGRLPGSPRRRKTARQRGPGAYLRAVQDRDPGQRQGALYAGDRSQYGDRQRKHY